MWLSEMQKIGAGLTAFGLGFIMLGILLLFDSGLIAIGDLLLVAGIFTLLGLQRTAGLFLQRKKIRGTVAFVFGIFLVLIKWPLIGIIVELFGALNLFGDFFPLILSFLRSMPFIGTVLNLPGISQVVDKIAGVRLPV